MQFDNIKDICSGLKAKAESERFLEQPVEDVEDEANKFVEKFAEENGLSAHTVSWYRWYFQTEEKLFEDGIVELRSKDNFIDHEGPCTFEVVDIAEIDDLKHNA